jgi:hypothetical protein
MFVTQGHPPRKCRQCDARGANLTNNHFNTFKHTAKKPNELTNETTLRTLNSVAKNRTYPINRAETRLIRGATYASDEHRRVTAVDGGPAICNVTGVLYSGVRIAGWPRPRPTFFGCH